MPSITVRNSVEASYCFWTSSKLRTRPNFTMRVCGGIGDNPRAELAAANFLWSREWKLAAANCVGFASLPALTFR